MKVWKEFFRLKGEEISEWFVPIMCMFLILVWCMGIAQFLFKIIMGGWDLPFFYYGHITISVTIFTLLMLFVKWLHSNWQQAKRNVEANND